MAKRESSMRQPLMEKLGLTVPEAAAPSSLGQTSIYKAIREGRLANSQVRYAHHHHAPDLTSFLEIYPMRGDMLDGPDWERNLQPALIGVMPFFSGRVAKSANARITTRRFLRASPRV